MTVTHHSLTREQKLQFLRAKLCEGLCLIGLHQTSKIGKVYMREKERMSMSLLIVSQKSSLWS